MRYKVVVFCFILFMAYEMAAQTVMPEVAKPGELYFRAKSISFVKNNEYFNPITEGYTLTGFMLRPSLVYSPSPKITLNAGVHLLKYSGTGKFTQIKPIFSSSLNLSDNATLTIGSLDGPDKHMLFDPHYDSERLYTDYAEDGLQFTFKNKTFFNDTWLSWENFIFKGDTTREVFTFGESFRYVSPNFADFLQVEIPLQVEFKHYGGQISDYPEQVETLFNFASGIKLNMELAGGRLGEAGIECLEFLNNQLNGEPESGISNGNATWIRLHYLYKSFHFVSAYWKAHNFYSPNGKPLYGSVSDFNPGVIVPDRKLFTNFLYISLLPESYFELFFGIETYYDVDSKKLDHAATLHLNFDKLFRLVAIK